MKKNMGNIDKLARIIVAIIIGVLYYTGQISGTIAIILLIVGVIFTITSIVGVCPLYSIFGISTTKNDKNIN
jgi:hypothetical protein